MGPEAAQTESRLINKARPRPSADAYDQFGLDRLEEGLNGGVIVAIALATHRHLEPMLAQDLLIVMRTILAAAIAVEDAAPRR